MATAGCEVEVDLGADRDVERQIVLDVPAERKTALDLLFVVDNSSDMEQRQLELGSSFDHLMSSLEGPDGELPDLHIGVISTDLGSGPFASAETECTNVGDQAALLTEARLPECAAIDGNFLLRQSVGGELLTNYSGGLAESFDCIARLGASGCDYEQPLEAMRRALDGSIATNTGFVRDGAPLAVVFVTDEDDCSARVPDLFDPANNRLPPAADPEWRCFVAGVTCSGVDDVFPPGSQAGCRPREDSPYATGVEEYVDFLSAFKRDPNDLVVSGIIGDPNLVEVELRDGDVLGLAPACADEGVAAYPGVRMRHFFDGFRGGAEYESLCGGERPMGILSTISDKIRRALGSTCLNGALRDVDPSSSGVQVDCVVRQEWPNGTRDWIDACDDRFDPTSSSRFPCYTIEPGNDSCNGQPSRLSLRVYHSASYEPGRRHSEPDLPGIRTIAECVVDPPSAGSTD